MKSYIRGIWTLIAIVAVLGGAVWLGRPNLQKGPSQGSGFSAATMIETGRPMRRDFSERLHWFGKVQSKRPVKIVSLTAGKVTAVKAQDGALVREGEVLFTLGGPQVMHTLETLKHRVAALEEQVSLARRMAQTKQEALTAKLAKRDELLAAQKDLAWLEGELSAARQKLAALQGILLVRSPMDGLFTNRRVSEGQDVEQNAHLADVMSRDLRIIALLFPPPEAPLEGTDARVEAGRGARTAGTVTKVLPERTPQGATVAWVEGGGINSLMKPGESASGWIALETHKNVMAVPKSAVVRDENEDTFVFVKTSSGYRKKAVRIGLAGGGWCEVVSGLSDKDEVVVQGAYELFYRDFTKTYRVAD